MKLNFTYLKKIWSASKDASSKRFNGTIGMWSVIAQTTAVVIVDLAKDGAISSITKGLVITVLLISAALLGLSGVLDKIPNKI